MVLDIYQLKTTYFIVTSDTKVVLYTKSEEIFFGSHNDVFTRLQKVLSTAPFQKWMMVSGRYMEKEFPKQFKEYAKICEGTYNGEG